MKLPLFFFFLGACFLHAGEEALSFLQKGNQAYEQEEFDQAENNYRSALNEGLKHSEVYYNLGNALFRQKKLGLAILNYEKALKLAPADEDIQNNLRFAYAQTADKHPMPEYNAITRIIWYLHNSYQINTGLWLVYTLFAMLFVFSILLLFTKQTHHVLIYPLMISILLVMLTLAPSVFLRINEQESARFAIVLTPVLEMLSGPGDTYQILSKVHEGTKFEIVEEANGWVKVKLPNGSGGFVKLDGLGKI